jgi:O-antigen/teichoic acid export membrane protein
LSKDHYSFFRHAAVYGLCNLLVQAGGVVLLPLYTHYLTPADYGVLEVLGRLAETVSTCLIFGGLRQALLTFYQQSTHEAERRRIVTTTLALLALTCVAGGGLVLAAAGPLSRALGQALQGPGAGVSAGLLRLAILAILLEPLAIVPMTLIQARVQSTLFVTVTLGMFLVRLTLCVALVAGFGWGVAGVLLATVLTTSAFGICLSVWELTRSLGRPEWGQVRALLRFALPFVPGGVGFFILHHGDRFFLLRHYGTEEVGLYALGYKVAQVVSTFSLTPLYMVWSARMYEEARSPEAPGVFGRAFTRILSAYLLVGLGLCLFEDEALAVLAGPAYARSTEVIPLVLLACFFQAGSSLMDAGFYVRHRTGLKLGITLTATALMLVLYALLIPPFGSHGAALATLGGFAFLAAHTWWTTQRVFPVRYEWPRLLTLVALAAALALAGRCLPAAAWAWPLKAGLWLALPLLAWQVGLISGAEKEYVRSLVRRVWGPPRGPSPPAPFGRRVRGTPPPAQAGAESIPVEEGPEFLEWQEGLTPSAGADR